MIALTGASGKTGTVLADLLSETGTPHVRLSSRPGVGDRRFDWLDRTTWAAALDGVDTLYLVKPPHGSGMAERVAALLEDRTGIGRVVLLSEMGRGDKDPEDPDRAVERVVEAWDGEWTVLRPSWFLQNFSVGGGFHDDVTGGTISLPTGDMPVSWIDTRDLAEAALVVLTEDGHCCRGYTLTGPESFGVAELARRLGAAIDRPVAAADPLGVDDILATYDDGTERGAYYAELLVDVAAGRYAEITGDTADLIGREPRTFDDFVRDHLADWE
ncbi:Rossmann-fold NAD(P)-binding domain-containing protein [Aeromicrobium choanae]|uniref:Uncharacterized conserved protein YbjT, contains NAD(P)-binding and DUF2867 domains n=1 Tax=Aeromicrobium choanae TaxID=1736691 RepID=A0A1T4YY72_9ACTN|nr:hypothetical protein [Aeromicrobium choanae]SKB06215.1 Uncharacterized conserved protein YbjT, contains NAD(P)-binding and DUF2867 domains [Aeromicrobium choanae]